MTIIISFLHVMILISIFLLAPLLILASARNSQRCIWIPWWRDCSSFCGNWLLETDLFSVLKLVHVSGFGLPCQKFSWINIVWWNEFVCVIIRTVDGTLHSLPLRWQTSCFFISSSNHCQSVYCPQLIIRNAHYSAASLFCRNLIDSTDGNSG